MTSRKYGKYFCLRQRWHSSRCAA